MVLFRIIEKEKATPVVKRGRKAAGLLEDSRVASVR
jgi:hypothetical protein